MSSAPEYVRIAHPCHTKAEWEEMENQLAVKGEKLWLYNGEIAFESDTNRCKVGKGPNISWSAIPYYQEGLIIERGLRTTQATNEDKKITAQIRDDQSAGGNVIAFQIKQGNGGSYEALLQDGTGLKPIATQNWVATRNFLTSSSLEDYYTSSEVDNKFQLNIQGETGQIAVFSEGQWRGWTIVIGGSY